MAFTFNLSPERVPLSSMQRDYSFLDTLQAKREDRKAGEAAAQSAQGLSPEQVQQVTPLLRNAQTRDEGLRMIREWRKPKEYGVQIAPDGTPLRIDEQAGTVEAIGQRGQYARPREAKPTLSDTVNERMGVLQQLGIDPESPEGRSYAATGQMPPNRQARVPVGIQNAEGEDLDAIQNLETINSELGRFTNMIKDGNLDLGAWNNNVAAVKNFFGSSDPKTRNYADFRAGLEKMRNDSLRLNKGVQTEGDAERAWNELFDNLNDPEVVKQRLDTISRLNGVASEYRRNRVGQRREDNNLNPLDINKMITAPGAERPSGQKRLRFNPATGDFE